MTTTSWLLLVSMGIMVVMMVVELRRLHLWIDLIENDSGGPYTTFAIQEFIKGVIRRRLFMMLAVSALLTYLFYAGLQ